MGNPSRWLNWQPGRSFENARSGTKPAKPAKPELQSAFGNAGPATKPSKPTKPLTEVETVGGYVVVAHSSGGQNALGQAAHDYPYCVVDRVRFRRGAINYRELCWFPTRGDAATFAHDAVSRSGKSPEPTRSSADFAAETAVVLRRDGPSRWFMYVNGVRRRDFASPYLDHAKRTAEFWFGEPLDGWTDAP